MRSLGLYLHIPFCRSKCLYCDFCSFPHRDGETVEAYIGALCRDLAQKAKDCEAHEVDTVYFGGGTPTYLSSDQLLRILDTVVRCYRLSPTAEITLECNPATASASDFAALRRGGFNRISIGLQSTHENELRALGRLHSFADFLATVEQVRKAGFANISADLMIGIPEQTEESFLQSIERLCALAPEHISAYGLSIEEGTPFDRMRERLAFPDEDTAASMYTAGVSALKAQGYAQYEISNFARAGYESRHNLKYWNCEEYLGFGPAAYSDFCGTRFGNSRDLDAYIEGKDICVETEVPTPVERMNEYVMLRMRLCEGVSAKAFATRFNADFEELFGKKLAAYEPDGFVRRTRDGWAFTAKGFSVSNAILSEVLDFS